MSERDAIADRATREVDALARLRRQRPGLFYVVVVGMVIAAGIVVYDRLFGIPQLKEDLRERDQRILLLETQLAPFRALALDRFPGQAEGEALARFATQIDELRREFEEAQNAIRSFSVHFSIRLEGEWTDGKLPNLKSLIRQAGDGNDVRIAFQLKDHSSRDLELGAVDSLRLSSVSDGVADMSYTVTAAPGSWVYGLTRKDFVACAERRFPLYGLLARSTTDAHLTIQRIRMTFFINGLAKFICVVESPGRIELHKESSTFVTWKGTDPADDA